MKSRLLRVDLYGTTPGEKLDVCAFDLYADGLDGHCSGCDLAQKHSRLLAIAAHRLCMDYVCCMGDVWRMGWRQGSHSVVTWSLKMGGIRII